MKDEVKPTPETDDFAKNLGQIYAKSKDAIAPAAYFVNEAQALIDKLVGKLERERDEANQKARNAHSILYGCDTHRLWSGYSCIGCIESERDLLQHQRNKGLETISALEEERDQLKERNKLLESENALLSVSGVEALKVLSNDNERLIAIVDEAARVVGIINCSNPYQIAQDLLESINQLPHVLQRNK